MDSQKPKDASPVNGQIPPVEFRWKPGQSGNPKGRTTLGAYMKEHLNSFGQAGLTETDLRNIARDKKQSFSMRGAAEQALKLMEFGDLSDFAGLLRGENNLEDLRAMGINTEVVKKFKKKTRQFTTPDGDREEIVEQEIELHDRAGSTFDRVVVQTDGAPSQHIDLETSEHAAFAPTQEEIDRLIQSADQDGPDDDDSPGSPMRSTPLLSSDSRPVQADDGGEDEEAAGSNSG